MIYCYFCGEQSLPLTQELISEILKVPVCSECIKIPLEKRWCIPDVPVSFITMSPEDRRIAREEFNEIMPSTEAIDFLLSNCSDARWDIISRAMNILQNKVP